MPRKGNMKPERSIDGRKKKNAICIACSWFLAKVEKVKPTARFAAMKTTRAIDGSGRLHPAASLGVGARSPPGPGQGSNRGNAQRLGDRSHVSERNGFY